MCLIGLKSLIKAVLCRSYLIIRIVYKQLMHGELEDIREQEEAKSPKDKLLAKTNTPQGLSYASEESSSQSIAT